MFTDSSGLILLIPILTGMFVLMARVDLYLAKRRNQIAWRVTRPRWIRIKIGCRG